MVWETQLHREALTPRDYLVSRKLGTNKIKQQTTSFVVDYSDRKSKFELAVNIVNIYENLKYNKK